MRQNYDVLLLMSSWWKSFQLFCEKLNVTIDKFAIEFNNSNDNHRFDLLLF